VIYQMPHYISGWTTTMHESPLNRPCCIRFALDQMKIGSLFLSPMYLDSPAPETGAQGRTVVQCHAVGGRPALAPPTPAWLEPWPGSACRAAMAVGGALGASTPSDVCASLP
jgi:hypothetical protein